MNTLLMWICGFLIAVLACLFAVPHLIDWNGYRGVFEEEATRILGRDVRVGGNVNLQLLPVPYVRFEKIRIADSESGGTFFRAESFTMWLSVPPLLKGVLEAKKVELEKPGLRLVTNTEGEGNWRNFSVSPGALPFVPTDIALQSVNIVDGRISFELASGEELGSAHGITGEFSARAISGPYTFNGQASWSEGKPFDVRIQTNEPGDDGTVRFKSKVRALETRGNSYALEGHINKLMQRPTLTATLTGDLSFDPANPDASIALTGTLTADAAGAKLSDMTATFENVAQAQIITGEMAAVWGKRTRYDITMGARWLDLDRLWIAALQSAPNNADESGKPDNTVPQFAPELAKEASARRGPMVAARDLILSLLSQLPSRSDIAASFEAEQVDLGGDRVGDLALRFVRQDGPMKLESLSAKLPGGARLESSGTVTSKNDRPVFSGTVFLGGPSASRLAKWALVKGANTAGFRDRPFSLSGQLMLAHNKVSLSQASAEFSGIPVRGGLTLNDTTPRKLSISLEGHEIDTRWIGLDSLDLASLSSNVFRQKEKKENDGSIPDAASDTAATEQGWLHSKDDYLSIKLKAGRLKSRDRVYHDVTANLTFNKGRVTIPTLNFTTGEGLSMQLDGHLSELGDTPKGVLNWIVDARNQAALKELPTLLNAGGDGKALADWVGPFAPARLAGAVHLGRRLPSASDINIDGIIKGGRVVAGLRLDGGLSAWRTAPVDVTASFENANVTQLFERLLGTSVVGRNPGRIARSGRGLIKAVGTPQTGVMALAEMNGDGLAVTYSGRFKLDADKTSSEGGEITVAAKDIRDVLSLVGVSVGSGAQRTGMFGTAGVVLRDDTLSFKPRDLVIGKTRLGGRIDLKAGAATTDPLLIDADLVVAEASIPDLMAPILSAPRPVEVQATSEQPERKAGARKTSRKAARKVEKEPPSPKPARKAVFPDQLFDFRPLDKLAGKIKLSARTLALAPGLTMENGVFEANLSAGRVEVASISGMALGGSLKANVDFAKANAGVDVTGAVNIAGVQLNKIIGRRKAAGEIVAAPAGNIAVAGEARKKTSDGTKPVPAKKPAPDTSTGATGSADLALSFSGRGLSPRALTSLLTGEGSINISKSTLSGMSPEAISQTAEAVLSGEVKGDGGELIQTMTGALGQGRMRLGPRKVKLTVADGAVQVEKIVLKNKAGQSSVAVTIDLATLHIDSQWRLSAKDTTKADKPWPDVTVNYVGPLGNVAALKPTLDVAALERELTVRRMERNVDELERLRKLDQEAAARQREHERQQELERQREAERQRELLRARELQLEQHGGQPGDPDIEGSSGNIVDPNATPPAQSAPAATGDTPANPDTPGAATAAANEVQTEPLEEVKQAPPAKPYRPRRKRRRKPKESAGDVFGRQFGGP